MRTVRPSSLWKGLAFCAVFALLSTGCTKEEVLEPVQRGQVKVKTPPPPTTDPGSLTSGGGSGTDSGISDDGDDQGDNEKGRKKPR
jgi:hypothetical protein